MPLPVFQFGHGGLTKATQAVGIEMGPAYCSFVLGSSQYEYVERYGMASHVFWGPEHNYQTRKLQRPAEWLCSARVFQNNNWDVCHPPLVVAGRRRVGRPK
jgi:hypothetical protein